MFSFQRISLLLILVLQVWLVQAGDRMGTGFKKGQFFFYWGYNRGFYSRSDINFKGADYNFTLYDVKAKDRQSKLGADPYLHIDQLTIPQYDYRLGYCFNDKYSLSIGFDHMKYVVNQNQTVFADGYINNSGTLYDGQYNMRAVELKGDFLEFEHTDGLNYLNAELSRTDGITRINKHLQLNFVSGFSLGFMYPRTRAVLLSRSINDQWHVSGYGTSLNAGINLTLGKHFYLQTTAKGGYINMPNIVVTGLKQDRAKQHFTFIETLVVLGYRFQLGRK